MRHTKGVVKRCYILMEPADQFYGDHNAGVMFPKGISWWIATHIEDVSEEEMERRSKERDA
ncbi:MAG: hypothetical protein R2759_10940 [Bacteroidales bacterium]